MPEPTSSQTPNSNDQGVAPVTPADARTYLADFVHDPASLTTLEDAKVLEWHKKVTDGVTKYAPKIEPPKIPEKYEFKFSDGIELDPKALETFTPILKKHGISQEVAQELATAWVAELSRQDGAINELYTGQMNSWEAASKADKELGGANFDANLSVARKGVAKYASPQLKEILDQSGLGNHPEVFRLFHKLGQIAGEDQHVSGSGTVSSENQLVSKLFDHPTSQVFKDN